MKENSLREQICPRCNSTFTEPPALSRKDNESLLCPDCGTREALESIGIDESEQAKIIDIIHNRKSQ